MIGDIFGQALFNLQRQELRTFLTLIGVIIGISAIVGLTSIGMGLSGAVEKQFEQLGSNIVFLIPFDPFSGASAPIELTANDYAQLQSISNVTEVLPLYFKSGLMEHSGEKINVQIIAADARKSDIFDRIGYFNLKEGVRPTRNDMQSIMVGEKIVNDYFSRPLSLHNTVTINGEEFRIVGILKESSNAVGDSGPNTGSTVFMSDSAFTRIEPHPVAFSVYIITNAANDADAVSQKVTDLLEKKYGKKSIYVYTSKQILDQINQIYALLTIFLVGIGAISLIVGGLGIANAMTTSVLERTKEIGLMKALGASDNAILYMFLIEAALIGFLGGLVGTILGYGFALLISYIGTSAGYLLEAQITPLITLGGIGFAMVVGMTAGFFPALRASKMDPVVALREE